MQFAALSDEPQPVRHVRGTALAVAMDWLIRLPDGATKEKAIEQLAAAAELACAAFEPAC